MSSEGRAIPNDEELMKAYGSNASESAFRGLYERYEKKLFNFFKKRLSISKSEVVDDLFQKTWLKIHASRHQYDSSRKFSTWFFTIALNTLRDHVGSSSEKVSHEEFDESAASHSAASAHGNQEHQLILKEDWARADSVLSALSGSQKEALLLFEWDGLSTREIGEVLGISDAAARQLLTRARSKIKSSPKAVEHD